MNYEIPKKFDTMWYVHSTYKKTYRMKNWAPCLCIFGITNSHDSPINFRSSFSKTPILFSGKLSAMKTFLRMTCFLHF